MAITNNQEQGDLFYTERQRVDRTWLFFTPDHFSPNPFQEKMEAYNSTDYRLTVQINDCSGKLMREIRVPAGQTTQIETIAWPAGIYVARFKNANGARAARPIVKM